MGTTRKREILGTGTLPKGGVGTDLVKERTGATGQNVSGQYVSLCIMSRA